MNNIKTVIDYVNKHAKNKYTFVESKEPNINMVYVDFYLNGKRRGVSGLYTNEKPTKEWLQGVVSDLNRIN